MSKPTVSARDLFLKQHLRVELAFKAYEAMMKSLLVLKKPSAEALDTELEVLTKKIL